MFSSNIKKDYYSRMNLCINESMKAWRVKLLISPMYKKKKEKNINLQLKFTNYASQIDL